MANSIKIGNSDATFKVGSSDVDAIYLGSTLVYSGGTPPTPSSPKWIATYSDSHTESAACDSTSAITSGEITLTNLVSVEIGNCVTSIGDYAFGTCFGLTSIDIPSGVTSIGDGAFSDCTSLTSVTIPNSVTSIGYAAFSDCTSLTSINIPNSVTSIGGAAFYDCTSLISINIPSGVTTIGETTFSECHNLAGIVIPDSVESIGEYAFNGCESMLSVTIGSGITEIGDGAFDGCTGLTSIEFYATTPPTFDTYMWQQPQDCNIYVPYSSRTAYQSADFRNVYGLPTMYDIVPSGTTIAYEIGGRGVRVSTAITLSESHNVLFGDTSSNTYALLYENGNWYNWRIMSNGDFNPDRKIALSPIGGYYTIIFNSVHSEYPCLGADADAYGQGGTTFATFDFEVGYN